MSAITRAYSEHESERKFICHRGSSQLAIFDFEFEKTWATLIGESPTDNVRRLICLCSNFGGLISAHSHRRSFHSFRFFGFLFNGRVLRHEQDAEIAFLRAQGFLSVEEKHFGAVFEESHAFAQELRIEEDSNLTIDLADGVVVAGGLRFRAQAEISAVRMERNSIGAQGLGSAGSLAHRAGIERELD